MTCAGLPGVLQSPRDITGEYNGRDQLIPAVYGTASLADQLQALPDEDALNGILGARSAPADETVVLLCSHMRVGSLFNQASLSVACTKTELVQQAGNACTDTEGACKQRGAVDGMPARAIAC